MTTGQKILQVFNFYLLQISKLFNLLDSLELFPGISYLDMLISIIIISVLLKIITFGIEKYSVYDEETDSYKTKTRSITSIGNRNIRYRKSRTR